MVKLSDERILIFTNKVYKEYLIIATIIAVLYEVYQRFIIGKATIMILLVLGACVYKEVRFSFEGTYTSNKFTLAKSYVLSFLFTFVSFDLPYNFLGSGRHFIYEKIIAVGLIIIPILYIIILKYLNARWLKQHL